jgi:hypothetical protein
VKRIGPQVFGGAAAVCTTTTGSRAALANYQDLWWNPAESGWGVTITHQADTMFAALFTYDRSGNDLWLVMTQGTRQADGTWRGDLYRTRGPAFNAQPFTPLSPGDVTRVGEARFTFSDGATGTLDRLADKVEDLADLLEVDVLRQNWLLTKLVDQCIEAGLNLKPGQVYSYKVPPSLGGTMELDNVEVMDAADHYHSMAEIQLMLDELPPDQTP